jgi:Flp pilus assembly protein TadG
MGTTSLFDRFRKLVRELRTANAANVTATFAFATIPMIALVGAAVDYSHANSVKAAMQAASDSTALMLSKIATTTTSSDLQTKGTAYFNALFTRPEATVGTVTSTYTTEGGSQVNVKATASLKTSFMGLMGTSYAQMQIGVDSKIAWGNSRLRVALVLDTTGSMQQDGKIAALKTATKGLLDQLKAAAVNNGDVYVSIIPFSKDVNVGKSKYQANWINWSDWEDNNGSCSGGGNGNGNGWGWGWGGGWGGGTGKSNCNGNWTPANHNTWNGCVVDRGSSAAPSTLNTDTNVMAPDITKPDTLFSAEQYDYCSQPVMTLNYDWAGMKSLVDSFTPDGNTNQGIGLAHGWMSLVGGGPYPTPPVEDPNYKYTKIIILMSDGLNTENRWYNNSSQINARQKMTCDNVNAAGITLYTIHVNTDGDPLSTLLKSCAGSPGKYPDADKFWMLTSASQLATVFQQIGTKLSNLRIAQ